MEHRILRHKNVFLTLADLFQILVRYTATKPKSLVKGTFTIFTELLNMKKKRTVQSLNMLIDRDKRGGCFTSLFVSLTSWPGIRRNKKNLNFCKTVQYQVPQWLTVHICVMKKKWREGYKGEGKRGKGEAEVRRGYVGTRSQSLSHVSLWA